MLVDEVADGLHERPAGRQLAEQRPGDVAQLAVDFAIAAGEQKQEHVVRQVLDPVLQRVPNLDVGQPIVFDEGIGAKRDAAGRNHGAATEIAVGVGVLNDRRWWIDRQRFEPANRGGTRGMDVRHQQNGRRLGKIKSRFEPSANDHRRETAFSAIENGTITFLGILALRRTRRA